MMPAAGEPNAARAAGHGQAVFERIVCGVDGSAESLEAVRQAARLRLPHSSLHLLSAVYLAGAVAGHWPAARIADELEREAGERVREALEVAGAATSRLVNGPAAASLLAELERESGTLICVGSHGHSRAAGILFGHIATTMLRHAPCSVLVARAPVNSEEFPASIAVGIDRSPEAAAAAALAFELAGRFGATVQLLAAAGETRPAFAAAVSSAEVILTAREPVEALVAAGDEVDLLLLGSRDVHGLRALGSVSERVAHRAACSVLVVRAPLRSGSKRQLSEPRSTGARIGGGRGCSHADIVDAPAAGTADLAEAHAARG